MPLNTDTIRAGASGATATSAFYPTTIDQSLRFDSGGSTYLNDTASGTESSTANRAISFWYKRTEVSVAAGHTVLIGYVSGPVVKDFIQFRADNTLRVLVQQSGGSNQTRWTTTRVFRDTSAWYHVFIKYALGESSNADKVKIYINGSLFDTDGGVATGANVTSSALLTSGTDIRIGSYWNTTSTVDGYLAEFNIIDGSANHTDFGETKNGVWIPKAYTGSYGNSGFRLTFADSANIGEDTSGNSKDFTANNFTAVDVMPDSPTNNFATFHSQGRRYGQSYVATFSEGNLKATNGGNATHIWGSMAINQIASQGGVYFEIRLDSIDTARTYFGVIGDNGINNKNSGANNASYTFPIKALINDDPYGYFATDSTSTDLRTGNTAFGNGDVAGIVILSDGKFFCHRNGTYMKNASGNTGDPSTGTNELTTIDLTLGDWVPYVGYNSSFSINFGQDGTFNGNETPADTYADANGIGNFNYPVPTNCLAICASNMEEPTIGPNSTTQADDHFNISLYQGNETAGNTGSGLGFQPDWLMFKNRDSGDYWRIYDSTRGTEKSLAPNDNDAEVSSDGGVTSFTAPANDGFTMGATSYVNRSGDDYVAWAWKANGGTTSTIAIDTYSTGVPSVASTVQANTDAGFSIITFPANGTNGTVVGHGLGKAPKMIITKQRPAISSWYIYHDAIGKNKWVRWNNPNTEGERTTASTTIWGNVTPDTNTFTIGNSDTGYNNGGANDVVAYCFAEIDGYSKFGSFIGNGQSTDGTFIYLGFRPRYFMMFLVSSASLHLWFVYDSKRGVSNQPINPEVYFSDQSYDAETTFVFADFVSNGIKIRNGNSARNPSAGEFLYMAFAENPFKYANAR